MNAVDVIFIIDNSGSMSGLEKDTLGGFNSVLQQQKQLNQKRHLKNTVPIGNTLSEERFFFTKSQILLM